MEQQLDTKTNQNDIESQYSRSMPVIGAQCTRSQLISGKPFRISNYNDKPLMQSWESYTREQSLGSRNDTSAANANAADANAIAADANASAGEDPNKVIQEKSDSNIPFIMNSKELESCQTAEQTINVLKEFMSAGFDDFEKRTGRKPTYSEMRQMYG